jgi:hypothetical protein
MRTPNATASTLLVLSGGEGDVRCASEIAVVFMVSSLRANVVARCVTRLRRRLVIAVANQR